MFALILQVAAIPIAHATITSVDVSAAVAAAEKRGLEVLALSRFSSRPLARDGLLLGFAAVDAHEIRRGVKELATALEMPSKGA